MVFSLLLLCGCWNYRELNEFSIVTGMAIDFKDNEYEVSLLFSNLKKSSGDSSSQAPQTVVLSDTGKTVYEAIKNIGLSAPKEMYFEHLAVVVLSEDVAREGIKKPLDFLLREPESRNSFYVLLSKNTSAKSTLTTISPLEEFPSQTISSNVSVTNKLQGKVRKTTFNEVVSIVLEKGIELTMSSITVIGDVEKGESEENIKKSVADTYIKLDTLGIFIDDKLVDWASEQQSTGINLINGAIEEAYYRVPCNDEGDYIIINTENLDRSIKAKLKDNVPSIDIKLDFEAIISETACSLDLMNSENMQELNQRSEDRIIEIVEDSIDVAKKNKADIFGFGHLFYANYYDYYKKVNDKWNDEIFPNLDINVDVKVNITSTGKAQNSSKGDDNER